MAMTKQFACTASFNPSNNCVSKFVAIIVPILQVQKQIQFMKPKTTTL